MEIINQTERNTLKQTWANIVLTSKITGKSITSCEMNIISNDSFLKFLAAYSTCSFCSVLMLIQDCVETFHWFHRKLCPYSKELLFCALLLLQRFIAIQYFRLCHIWVVHIFLTIHLLSNQTYRLWILLLRTLSISLTRNLQDPLGAFDDFRRVFLLFILSLVPSKIL